MCACVDMQGRGIFSWADSFHFQRDDFYCICKYIFIMYLNMYEVEYNKKGNINAYSLSQQING